MTPVIDPPSLGVRAAEVLAPSRSEELGTRAYLLAARPAADALRRLPHVETVFLHRSVSAHEVSFGRSDIDFGLVLDGELTGAEVDALVAILARYRRLRRGFPLIGECLVLARGEVGRYATVDPFRASLARRAGVHLAGSPLGVPFVAQSLPSACERVCFWFDVFLAQALRSRNRRNLRKLAVEVWNAYAVATGQIAEPFVARRDAEAAWRGSHEAGLLRDLDDDPRRAFEVSCRIAGLLHGTLLEPLPGLRGPLVFQGRPSPRRELRTIVVTPDPVSLLPRASFGRDSFVVTPEVLDLYLRYVNPYAWFELEPQARMLGIEPPPPSAFRLMGLSLLAPWRLRFPGFNDRSTGAAAERLVAVSLGLEGLGGRRTVGVDTSRADDAPAYYRAHYTRLVAAAEELRVAVERLPGSP